jgi:HAD superfamily hydrolase (TIGR01509 family)
MIKALIFDFDGLILDTETPDFESWRQTYATFACELSFDVWCEYIGTTTFNPYEYLESLVGGPVDRTAVHTARKALDIELIAQQTILPGVVDYLDEAQTLGLQIALASSSDHSWVDAHLARLGLLERFPIICCADDVGGRPKPDPAVYRLAIERLGIAPEEGLALEDSPNGIRAGKGAGLWVTAVPNQMTKHLNFDHADFRVGSLAEMPLQALISRVMSNEC